MFTKQLILAVLLSMLPHALLAQAEGDLASEGLRGRVKTVTEIQYLDGYKTPFMKTVDKYDTRGRLTDETHNDYILRLNTGKVLKYDTAGDGSVVKLIEYNDSGAVIRAISYKYDQHRVVETADQRNFGDKVVVYKSECDYDSTGRKIKERNYTDGVLNHTTVFTYGSSGRLSGTKSYDKQDKVVMQYDYNYLADAQWVHCEKQIGAVRTHIFRIIDSAGLVLEKTTYVGDYSKQTTESYSNFDSKGNWLKQSVKGNVTENYYVARVIEYYKDGETYGSRK